MDIVSLLRQRQQTKTVIEYRIILAQVVHCPDYVSHGMSGISVIKTDRVIIATVGSRVEGEVVVL